jgi:hypothetical protein
MCAAIAHRRHSAVHTTTPLKKSAQMTTPIGFVCAVLLATVLAVACPVVAAEDFSATERALFMTPHLSKLKPPTTLRYRYRKSGSLEEGFEDQVLLTVRAQGNGACCVATTQFLSGSRSLSLPEVEAAQGNPVILYFLERDIREMQRLTKGQANYFRKRIRMAASLQSTVKAVSLQVGGREVAGREITLTPYLDDPLRARFENLANKEYVFTLSDAVPGGVVAMRTRVVGAGTQAPPLMVEEMWAEGAAPRP